MYDCFQPTGIFLLVDSLTATSPGSGSIRVLWTVPDYPPTGYELTSVCMLLCGAPVMMVTPMTATSFETSVTFSGIPPGSVCNITLTAQGSSTSSNEPMVTATTLSESEHTILNSLILHLLTLNVPFCNKQNHQEHPLTLMLSQRTAHPSP